MVILAAVAFVYCWEAIPMSSEDKRGSLFYTLLGYLAILAILLVIALAIGAGLYWFVILPKRFPPIDAVAKWIGLAVFTPITFWWLIKESGARRHRRMFWIILAVLLIVHLASFLISFRYVQRWPS
jgi:flagellar basal body-associated protein FliL